jgi:capsular polysaccharide transport system permease protein
MHGITNSSDYTQVSPARMRANRLVEWVKAHRNWIYVVLLPTLATAFYLYVVTADQYESEAHFMVRSATPSVPDAAGLGQALTLVGGVSSSQSEAMSVGDYLTSHDAVAALEQRVNLVERFRRPEADLFARLGSDNPAPETLLKYYRRHVDVHFDTATGIATLKVRAFRPTDSYAIVTSLLGLGEQRVNSLNQRAYLNTLGVARRQLAEAENGVTRSQRSLTSNRQQQRDINPQASGQAQITLVAQLQAQLSALRAQESALAAQLSPSSPQVQAMRSRVAALQSQVNAQSSRLTTGRSSIAAGLGNYQELELRQQFAAKRYDAAAAGLEKAREQAQRQQLFVVRVVEPNMPEKALYPQRLKILLTVFFGLLLTYGIGWLIIAGVREHAA